MSNQNQGQSGTRQGQGRGQLGFGGLGFVVKGVAAGIGLASESLHHHKEKKAAKKAAIGNEIQESSPQLLSSNQDQVTDNGPPVDELEEDDEEQWDLDDAQDELIQNQPVDPKKRPLERDPKKFTQRFIDDYPIPQGLNSQGERLRLPVVLPQRRPEDRTRGFIRAYAPELMNAGIDEAMFLDFLDTFNTASQASPWINAINLASVALMPLHLATGVSVAVSVALYMTVKVMENMQSRQRYNSVLDQLNAGFFQPRGLYCMVLTWDPDSDQSEVGININETIHQNLTPPEGIAKVKHALRTSMGKTSGVAFPETAPLVFPALDRLAGDNSDEAKSQKAKLQSAVAFTGDYFDRRARAKFEAKAPDSQLAAAGPKSTFTSRYSDPNNVTNSGDIVALLTAGKASMPAGFGQGLGGGPSGGRGRVGFGGLRSFDSSSRLGMRGGFGRGFGRSISTGGTQQPQDQELLDHTSQGGQAQQIPNRQGDGQTLGPQMIANGVKRILRHHVLYLLIVNMPTEEEMADASKLMSEMKAQEHSA